MAGAWGAPGDDGRAGLVGLRCWARRGLPLLVFYRVVVGGIEVVHVLHGARDRGGITE